MSVPLLVEFFNALPEDALRGGLDWPIRLSISDREDSRAMDGKRVGGKARRRAAIHVFCKQVRERYTGTLLRALMAGTPGLAGGGLLLACSSPPPTTSWRPFA
jgi:hypothetical protein